MVLVHFVLVKFFVLNLVRGTLDLHATDSYCFIFVVLEFFLCLTFLHTFSTLKNYGY